MICNKKKILRHSCPVQKKVFIANLTGSMRDVGHRKLLSWDQEDIAHCGGIVQFCSINVDKWKVGKTRWESVTHASCILNLESRA